MAEYSAGVVKLLPYLGNIQSAAAAKMSTADLWATVRAAADAEGVSLSPANAIDMGVLRSFAVTNRNAAAAFNAAPADASLNAAMLGTELYARPLALQADEPLYLVRFEHNVLENGLPVTVWRTDTFRGLLPPTKEALMELLNADAGLIGEDYNQTHVSIGQIAISVA